MPKIVHQPCNDQLTSKEIFFKIHIKGHKQHPTRIDKAHEKQYKQSLMPPDCISQWQQLSIVRPNDLLKLKIWQNTDRDWQMNDNLVLSWIWNSTEPSMSKKFYLF